MMGNRHATPHQADTDDSDDQPANRPATDGGQAFANQQPDQEPDIDERLLDFLNFVATRSDSDDLDEAVEVLTDALSELDDRNIPPVATAAACYELLLRFEDQMRK